MAGEISVEVREVVRRAIERGLTYEEAAELAGVGRASVSRWMRKLRETGTVEARPRGGGNTSALTEDVCKVLVEIVGTNDNLTDAQIAAEFTARTGIPTSRSSVRRAFQRLGFTRKKSPSPHRRESGPTSFNDVPK